MLPFQKSIELFGGEESGQFHVPNVIVISSDYKCIAQATNREILKPAFIEAINTRTGACKVQDANSILKELGEEFHDWASIMFLVLTDTGGTCVACEEITTRFERDVLPAVDAQTSVVRIDVGMSAWFAEDGGESH